MHHLCSSTPAEPARRLVPGLLGMAVNTDCVYLKALQELGSELANTPMSTLRVLLHTIDFAGLVEQLRAEAWPAARAMIMDGAAGLARAGADFLVITANTGAALMSSCEGLPVPVLRITDVTFAHARRERCQTLGLLSTVATVKLGLYQEGGLVNGIAVLTPPPQIATEIDRLIFDDLIQGRFNRRGAEALIAATEWFARQGADAVALACTDLTHLLELVGDRAALPMFDTTTLHARAAARVAMGVDSL